MSKEQVTPIVAPYSINSETARWQMVAGALQRLLAEELLEMDDGEEYEVTFTVSREGNILRMNKQQ